MKLGDIFRIKYGGRDFLGIENSEHGSTPVITSQGENNGICGFFDIDSNYKSVISVSRTGSFCEAFYHDYYCYITDDCMVLLPKIDLSINRILWYVLLIRKNKYKFTYGRKITPSRLAEINVPNEIPEYVDTMEFPKLPSSNSLVNEKLELDIENWKYFKIGDLFYIEKGKELKRDIDNYICNDKDKIPLISSSFFNNGCVGFLSDGICKFKKNKITVASNGTIGITFYQLLDFFATSDINVLTPRFKMNIFVAMFLKVVIQKERYRFNYGRKCSQSRIKQLYIHLPSSEGNPDWQYMERYIKSLPYSSSL